MWRKHARHYCTHKETDLQSLSALVCWAAEVYGCRESRKPFPHRFLSREQEWRVWCSINITQSTLALTVDIWILSSVVLTAVMVWRQKWAKALGKRNLPSKQLPGAWISSSYFYNKVEPLSTLQQGLSPESFWLVGNILLQWGHLSSTKRRKQQMDRIRSLPCKRKLKLLESWWMLGCKLY